MRAAFINSTRFVAIFFVVWGTIAVLRINAEEKGTASPACSDLRSSVASSRTFLDQIESQIDQQKGELVPQIDKRVITKNISDLKWLIGVYSSSPICSD